MLARNRCVSDPDRNIDYEMSVEYEPSTLEFFIASIERETVWYGDYGEDMPQVQDDRQRTVRKLEWIAEHLCAEITTELQKLVSAAKSDEIEQRGRERMNSLAMA